MKKFDKYHSGYFNKNLSEDDFRSMVRTAYRAENFVDKWAKKKMKEYFPNNR